MLSFFLNRKKELSCFKLIFFFLVIVPVAALVIATIAVLSYTYWPIDYSKIAIPVLNPQDRHVFVLAHGVRDTSAGWCDPLAGLLKEKNPNARIIPLDWSAYAESTFRCSVNGKRIGLLIGHELAAGKRLESMHLIGHSCGAFLIEGICEAVKSERKDVLIQTTFLDPVSVYGGIFWNYGVEKFGSCSDFSDSYIDTGDPVPGSNDLIPHTITFDVTGARKKSGFKGLPHVWPVVYYQGLVREGRNPELIKDSGILNEYSPGTLVRVEQ